MTANEAKNALLRYFRFQRGYPYVATECWNEDVVASNGHRLVCVEVKISWADYRREFKKPKYIIRQRYPGLPRRNDPNRKFFAAPSGLAERIAEDLAAASSEWGVLRVHCNSYGDCQVSVLRKARERHANAIKSEAVRDLVLRLTSELITMREQVRA